MTREAFAKQYQSDMAGVRVSPQLRRMTLDVIEGKETPVMKKKLSAALVFAIALMLCAMALAAATRLGMLDFAGRISTIYIPKDAQQYMQRNVLHMENELVTVDLRELYFDGLVSRITVDVKPTSSKIMLLPEVMTMEDAWISMTPMDIDVEEIYTETVLDVYRRGGYEAAYRVSHILGIDGNEMLAGSCDHSLSDDGTLTLYQEWELLHDQPQCEATFTLSLFPYDGILDRVDIEGRIDLEQPLTLTAAKYSAETYESTEPVDFPSIGVRVEKLTLDVRPLEIHSIIDFTVTNAALYESFEGSVWFEFIDPNSTETEPRLQRLQEGLTAGGMVGPTDQTKLHYRQKETLGRNELHNVYTLRVFSAWDKTRYETKEIPVVKK